ncbi:hypothetical protein [Achromobacter sp. Bel]|uniref:hypothetical protein n=1 Tax=Achromobacter sp. Bel TaxID=2727415 RepID=UPI00145DE6D2|nr:hypothetical protein [Achromobacter sp. Bel]NMK48499.1 hypothetical protein [Achromobacter sp. Bel]
MQKDELISVFSICLLTYFTSALGKYCATNSRFKRATAATILASTSIVVVTMVNHWVRNISLDRSLLGGLATAVVMAVAFFAFNKFWMSRDKKQNIDHIR